MPEVQKRSWWLGGTGSGAPFSVQRYWASGSSELHANVAVVPSPVAGGVFVSVTTGGVMSPLVHSCSSGVWSTLPAGLFARTCSSWSPCGMFVIVCGELHGVKVVVSSAHSKLAFALGELKVKVSVVLSVSIGGRPAVDSTVSGASSMTQLK